MKKISYSNLLYLFILGSSFGWLVEVLYSLIRRGVFINHSALVIGPFNIIYGFAVCLFSLLLINFKNSSIIKQFLVSFIGGSILEYIMSFLMELTMGFTAWNYQRYWLNINGRICFLFSVFWGILGVLWIRVIQPQIDTLLSKIKPNRKVVLFLTIFLIMDSTLTISAIIRAKQKEQGIVAKNVYDKFLDKTFNQKYLKNMFNNKWK